MDTGHMTVQNGIHWILQWNLDFHMVAIAVTFGCLKMTGSNSSNQWQFVSCQNSFQITIRKRYHMFCTYVYTHTVTPVSQILLMIGNFQWLLGAIVTELWFLRREFRSKQKSHLSKIRIICWNILQAIKNISKMDVWVTKWSMLPYRETRQVTNSKPSRPKLNPKMGKNSNFIFFHIFQSFFWSS